MNWNDFGRAVGEVVHEMKVKGVAVTPERIAHVINTAGGTPKPTAQFAVPTSPYAVNDEDLATLRQQLTDAEAVAARATDWTARTRAEQDAIILRRQLNAAEVHRRAETAKQATQSRRAAETEREDRIAQAAKDGHFAPPVPYFVRPQ